jgi:hypothetical protein
VSFCPSREYRAVVGLVDCKEKYSHLGQTPGKSRTGKTIIRIMGRMEANTLSISILPIHLPFLMLQTYITLMAIQLARWNAHHSFDYMVFDVLIVVSITFIILMDVRMGNLVPVFQRSMLPSFSG